MMQQASLDLTPVVHPFSGAELATGGMKVAIDHADQKHEHWSSDAAKALDLFLKHHEGEFMGEDVREYAHKTLQLELPPSARSWGGVLQGAAKAGIIRRVGTGTVKTASSHCAQAARWVKA